MSRVAWMSHPGRYTLVIYIPRVLCPPGRHHQLPSMDSHQSDLSATLVSSSWRNHIDHPLPPPAQQPSHHQWQHPQSEPQQRHPWPSSSASYALHYTAYTGQSGPDFDNEYRPTLLAGPSYHPLSHSQSSSSSSPAASSSSQSSSPRFPHSSDWDADLYRFEPDQAHDAEDDIPQLPNTVSLSPSPPPRPQSPCIKEEDVSVDGFIFEGPKATASSSHAFAPMAEVPLRATQATKAQRRFMGVFRLDPFAINNPSAQLSSAEKDTDYSGEKIGPLKEPGREFQFQLELYDALKPELAEVPPVPSVAQDRSVSPDISLSYPVQEDDEAMQQAEWDVQPRTSLYSVFGHDPSSFVPTPVHSLNWLKLQGGSSADGSAYSDSPPLRTLDTSPYLSSSRELRMPDHNKNGYNRLSPYSASSSLRLPPPTPSSRYVSMPQIQSNDDYSDEPESSWFNKNIPLSTGYYGMQKDESADSLSSSAPMSIGPIIGSLANATKYRPSLGGSIGYQVYSSSLNNMHADRLRYS
ncbi:hypothetical protein BDY19DRAFT_907584 [Irpex rosettiformis]|uniref:Uncharacterized protein n=1 Tax=Irpex rosettiformis TaxID=378272 RepID=A0ACB8TZA1_9APHY|nr:hypothetical protein BDY19DRAFT_907584 [Irpex rosettiformis]